MMSRRSPDKFRRRKEALDKLRGTAGNKHRDKKDGLEAHCPPIRGPLLKSRSVLYDSQIGFAIKLKKLDMRCLEGGSAIMGHGLDGLDRRLDLALFLSLS
jgi:hypothetical protein